MASTPPRAPVAGGCLLALSLIVGVVFGIVEGEPSWGFVLGLAVGLGLLALVWAIDRARGR